MKEDETHVCYPTVDYTLCVECKACENACPALNGVAENFPSKAFAAWNNDAEERKLSASGGVASAIYRYATELKAITFGARLDIDSGSVKIEPLENGDFSKFKNSKYCYSDPSDIFSFIKSKLNSGENIIAIGLPCQTAAYKRVFGERKNITYIDLVCHGVAPASYLKQHINSLKKNLNQKIVDLSFRAPEKGTENYFFTLYDENGEILYSKRSSDGELYNIAFHRGISYRENCYHCHYAKPERCSDITLGDFHGLGTETPCKFSDKQVSVILTNTPKGETLIRELIQSGLIFAEERPLNEPLNGDLQLKRPTPKSTNRLRFEKYISKYAGDFEKTVNTVLNLQRRSERIEWLYSFPKRIVKKLLRYTRLIKG